MAQRESMPQGDLSNRRRVMETGQLVPYTGFGKVDPTLDWLPLSGTRGSGFECFLIRFKPGAVSNPHEHTGIEEFLVLEGELEDSDGAVFTAGQFVAYEAGTRHFSRSPKGCLLLVVLRGVNRALAQDEGV